MDRFALGKVRITKTCLVAVVDRIKEYSLNKQHGYICLMDTRTAYLANQDEGYCSVQNHSLMTLPDGMPLVWFARMRGYTEVGKVSGKDFMDAIFAVSEQEGYTHYFYGGSGETIEKIQLNLKQKYPGLVVLGAVSPPFQPLEDFDIESLGNELNRIEPDFFWCGLGAPKQEMLISSLQQKVQGTFCVGVGLAFEYFAGTVKRAPLWMQKRGLEWVYRLAQQPRNIQRVIKPFLWVMKELLLSTLKNKREQGSK